MALNVLIFASCLALVLYSSGILANGLDRIGYKLGLSDALLGVLTALGADSPEISSALVALMSGQNELCVGIVLGSNLFNLAALLGLGRWSQARCAPVPPPRSSMGALTLSSP